MTTDTANVLVGEEWRDALEAGVRGRIRGLRPALQDGGPQALALVTSAVFGRHMTALRELRARGGDHKPFSRLKKIPDDP